ncbi:class A beta-lactamase-related serine hydrolase [Nocardioides mangrovicus]|uniref:Class A beta-lactamase-related serine hydrolase n=1 Tax=Nocardioides mangrovicus TaxID=2478913 RepID=A0A3L8NZP0_9ACTN|nr:serine hydrolase domain-containing protein [Nocardioides mangrovicus]RLV48655.1 class A beta-lactamase-related serine hydrolase [Nocardioides mangrovicus]
MSAPATLLGQAQREGRLPSMVGGLVRGGELAWCGGVGEVPGPVSDTQYRIGSITKTLTAVLLLQAREAGLLRLDAPLSTYVPEAPFGDRTLRGVLSHSAGLPAEPAGAWWERYGRGDFASLAVENADLAPMADEGVEYRYSNLGFGLLGEVTARVLGASWTSLVQTRILDPLGMRRTSYAPVAPRAQGWSVAHLTGELCAEPDSDTGAMAPAGQLWSTVADLATYAGFVLRGHPDVLPLAVLQEASTEVLPGSGYGLGFRISPTGLVGHTGTMPGFMASFFCDRAAGTAYVGFADATTGQRSLPLATAMLEALAAGESLDPQPGRVPWRPTAAVPADVAELLGPWCWGERAFELRWNDEQLELVELRGDVAYEEYHLHEGRWTGTDRTELEVVRGPAGTVERLVTETYEFTRTPSGR